LPSCYLSKIRLPKYDHLGNFLPVLEYLNNNCNFIDLSISFKIQNMKTLTCLFTIIFVSLVVFSCKPRPANEVPKKADIADFTGQWTIDIQGGMVGWIDVRQEDGYLDADLLWKWGSVEPVANVFLTADRGLIVTRTGEVTVKADTAGKALRSHKITSWLEIHRDGDKIAGFFLEPRQNGTGVDSTSFTGIKLPPVPPAPDLKSVKYGKPIQLFNGKDLTGWRLIDEKQKNGFSAVNGVIQNDPVQVEGQPHVAYGNLRTDKEFSDFNLKLEVNVPEKSNSGIYLKGMYEIQVVDSYGLPLDPHNMGALYSRITPSMAAEKPAGSWQSMDITLCDRHVTVILNGKTIIDNQPVYGPTGGAIISDVFASGPIYLQGDHGKVMYRNIVLTPIEK
jgi:hypothetical protein